MNELLEHKTQGVVSQMEGMNIHPLTLHFRDSAFERQFHQSWLNATARVNQVWVMCGIGFHILYTLLLFFCLPADQHDLLWLRYGLALPVIVFAQIPLFLHQRLGRLLGLSYLAGTLVALAVDLYMFSISSHDHHIVYLFEIAVIYIYGQHYNRILFIYCLAFTVIAGTSTVALLSLQPGLLNAPIVPLAVAIAALGLVGIFSSYTRETFVRRNYRTMQILRGESQRNADLANEAMAASEAKSRFLAIASHELRTPLNAIIGFSEMITSGVYGAISNDRVTRTLNDITNSAKHLSQIVNDVLDLSKATSGSMELKEAIFDCEPLLAELKRTFQAQCTNQGVDLRIATPNSSVLLDADRRLVQQMLTNLISNSLKFTSPGDRISVELALLASGELIIEVNDSGIGIAADKLEAALDMFSQVDNDLDRRYEGLGIGLPLTKDFIELHGGNLQLTSQMGVGTTVTLTFPASRVSTAGPTSSAAM